MIVIQGILIGDEMIPEPVNNNHLKTADMKYLELKHDLPIETLLWTYKRKEDVAEMLGMHPVTIWRWRKLFPFPALGVEFRREEQVEDTRVI